MKAMYGMRSRGFSLGCQPMSGLIYWRDTCWRDTDDIIRYHSILIYNRRLTEEEIKAYELEYISEQEDEAE